MERENNATPPPQYSLWQTLLVWAAAAIPMGILGWLIAPTLAANAPRPAIARVAVLTAGLLWQFVLVLLLVYREAGNLRWSTLKERLWLRTPRSPHTGEPRCRLWWWLVPLTLLIAVYQMLVSGAIGRIWTSIFPFMAEPPGYSLGATLDTPEGRAQFLGAWDIWGLFMLQALFNTFLGEELLFRGLLLPRMGGALGKWDWVVNGALFGLYHLHQPWGILSSAIEGILLLALPSRRFRSAWFGIIAHSGQSIYFAILLLGLVLGLA